MGLVDDPRVLTAPAEPYRVDTPFYRRGSGVLELPIGVTRDFTGRLPYIGTYLVLGGTIGARVLTRLIAGRALVNIELHGIDAAPEPHPAPASLKPALFEPIRQLRHGNLPMAAKLPHPRAAAKRGGTA